MKIQLTESIKSLIYEINDSTSLKLSYDDIAKTLSINSIIDDVLIKQLNDYTKFNAERSKVLMEKKDEKISYTDITCKKKVSNDGLIRDLIDKKNKDEKIDENNFYPDALIRDYIDKKNKEMATINSEEEQIANLARKNKDKINSINKSWDANGKSFLFQRGLVKKFDAFNKEIQDFYKKEPCDCEKNGECKKQCGDKCHCEAVSDESIISGIVGLLYQKDKCGDASGNSNI